MRDTAKFANEISHRLQKIYKSRFHEGFVNRILAITFKHMDAETGWNEKDILLITYGNSIQSDDRKPLQTLFHFLQKYLSDTISCVHILPFFPYTSDDGFSVSDYLKVNPALGSWEDMATIGDRFELMADLVINHVSSQHPWFKNYISNIDPGKDYFIEYKSGVDYSRVIRPRSSSIFSDVVTTNGLRKVWTTFSSDQVDLDFSNPEVLLEMINILAFYLYKGIKIIRLDAIAFLWKNEGSTCLHLPETHEIVKLLRTIANFINPASVILTETNVPNLENWSYFGDGSEAQMVYQFSLPPLLLHALFSGNSWYLKEWAKIIPEVADDQTFLNYTASHDGIGIRPLEGILPAAELQTLIEGMRSFGAQISMKTNSDGSLSPYEINITYFDAMKGDQRGIDDLQEARFICSQTIMLALKGIPAFYIHSLLATPNDYEGANLSGRARSINRKNLKLDELETMLKSDATSARIFSLLTDMIRLRKQHSAFHPESYQIVFESDPGIFAFSRQSRTTGEKIVCISNVSAEAILVNASEFGIKNGSDLISNKVIDSSRIGLNPYQNLWILEEEAQKLNRTD